ncbi:MAG: Holliday junction branch migration protein RuvA [Alphaproteobacteria bacterium]|nr:Holliday junction branch migration protein RuvA [Alphaproteobacteria bacterium]
MIGKLSGILDSIDDGRIVLDVGGVGYVVTASARTLRRLGSQGEAARLLIETFVREDAINLYGFIDSEEQAWFRLLTTVQGVGARVALAILSVVPLDALARAIAAQDKTVLTQADGVGPKLALRIVTELKDKGPALAPTTALQTQAGPSPSIVGDAVSALLHLGYRRVEAFATVSALYQRDPSLSLDALLRASLQGLSKDNAA